MERFKWRHLKIGQKYLSAFSVVMILFLISGIISFYLLNDIGNKVQKMEKKGARATELSDLASLFKSKDIRVGDYLIGGGEKASQEFEEKTKAIAELQSKLEPQMTSKNKQKLFNQIIANDSTMNSIFNKKIKPAVDHHRLSEAEALRQQESLLRSDTVDLLEQLQTQMEKEKQAATDSVSNSIKSTAVVLAISIILSIILGIAGIAIISRMIRRRFKQLIENTKEIAGGNLTAEMADNTNRDELGQMSRAIRQMRDNLTGMVSEIAAASEDVSASSAQMSHSAAEVSKGSHEISSTMQELSSGIESQASSTSTVAETVGEFIERLQKAAANGKTVRDVSEKALVVTEEGAGLMNESKIQMNEIYESVEAAVGQVKELDQRSKEVAKLIRVIDEIAEQTNLLALNASIEAARAGEEGRGFAVVAEEIRKLSIQVADSVTDISGIIKAMEENSETVSASLKSSYEQVEEGAKKIGSTGESFESIKTSMSDISARIESMSDDLNLILNDGERMNEAVENIASISEESSAGIEQTAASVEEVHSTMDEISSSAGKLSELSTGLNSLVSRFKVK